MRQWITKNFKDVLIIALLAVLLFKVFGKPTELPGIKIVRDTVYVYHRDTVTTQPVIYTSIAPKPKDIPPVLIPDTNYYKLKSQYEDLRDKFLTKNVYKDTLKVDSLGYVATLDTVQNNRLANRKWDYNLRERIITNTITKTLPDKGKVFYGFEVEANSRGSLQNYYLGGIYKTKRDRMIGLGVGYNFPTSTPLIKIGFYTKLHLGP